jgi:GTP-binding protein Era
VIIRRTAGFVDSGRPNAGKSTLLNALLGRKLAIVAAKPQTTRTSIQGVLTLPEAQIVFVDTPGIHKSNTLLNKRMMDSVRTAASGRDVVLFVIDALAPFSESRCPGGGSGEEDSSAGHRGASTKWTGWRQARSSWR